MIITKKVKIKLNRNKKYWKDKNYIILEGAKEIEVLVEDLPRTSLVIIDVKCDYCDTEFKTKYRYAKDGEITIKKHSCNKCKNIKAKEIMMIKYGVESPMHLPGSMEKIKKHNLEKYGVEYSIQSKEVREKGYKTSLKKYGNIMYINSEQGKKDIKKNMIKKHGVEHQMHLESVKNKVKETNLKKYGTIAPMQNEEIKAKSRKTCLERYGVETSMQNKNILKKGRKTLLNNGKINTSKNQKYLCELFNGILNFPLDWYNLDIFLQDENIVCEYSGGGHNLSVVLGTVTQNEFNVKEIIRRKHIYKNGYKLITIISNKDKLLSDYEMIKLKDYAVDYLLKNKERHWMEIDIDKMEIRTSQFIKNITEIVL